MASDKKKAKKLASELLKRRAAGETPKSQLSSQLLDLIETFFEEIGYTKSSKALRIEREKYSDGTKDKLPNSSSLAAIFQEWQISKSSKIPEVGDKKEQNKKDLKKGLKKNSASSEGAHSSKSRSSRTCEESDDDSSDLSSGGGTSLQNSTNVKLVNKKKRKASTSSSASDSDSSTDYPVAKRKKTKIMARVDDVSKSSSRSNSDSDNTSGTTSSDASTPSSDSEIIAQDFDSSSSESSDSDPQHNISIPKILAIINESDSSIDSNSSNPTCSGDSSCSSDSDGSSDSSGSSDSDSSSDSSSSVPKKVLSSTPKKILKKDVKDKVTPKNSSAARVKSKEESMKAENPTPTTVNSAKSERKIKEPFSRIPKDIKVDKKLASNAYVPYDYAQKAHEDLIVTKGKGFTKEKNKKKRGSYRGGHIDVDGKNGIKFED